MAPVEKVAARVQKRPPVLLEMRQILPAYRVLVAEEVRIARSAVFPMAAREAQTVRMAAAVQIQAEVLPAVARAALPAVAEAGVKTTPEAETQAIMAVAAAADTEPVVLQACRAQTALAIRA